MKKDKGLHLKDKILSYFVLPSVVGIVTGALIFLFKLAASFVMNKSQDVYSFVRQNPKYFPLLLLAVSVIGVASAFFLKWAKECRGGGIPTAVATTRGLLSMKWVQCIFGLFFSSMLTFAAGVPLGNEGPSVQMGTAVGKGVTASSGKKNRAWDRYNMTGGASAGFAIATSSPLTGIVFALEELHRRFSPPVFIVATVSVITGTATSEMLSALVGIDTKFLHFSINNILPLKYLWIPVLIGIVCGISANLLTRLYHTVRNVQKNSFKKLPFTVRIILIFVLVGVLGFASADFIGSGHSLIESILRGHTVWYLVLLAFIVRALVMLVANGNGVSGGMFVPTLALGAMIASLVTDVLIGIGVIDGEYYAIFIVVGIAAFLSASSRIPLAALTFAAEALCVVNNMLPVAVGVVIAYLVVEVLGVPSFTDVVIDLKLRDVNEGKMPIVVDSHMTVQPGAFAIGMEVRDILWPPTCTILSVSKKNSAVRRHYGMINEGDIIHLHYRTYEPAETLELLSYILGEQPEDGEARVHAVDDNHHVPGD